MKEKSSNCIELTPELLQHKEECLQRWKEQWKEAGVIAAALIAKHTFRQPEKLKQGAIQAANMPGCKTTLSLIYQQLKARRPKKK